MSARALKRDKWHRARAYELWVVVQATVEETCASAEITPKTLRKWRTYYGWDEERKKFGAGLGGLMAAFREQLEGIASGLRTAAQAGDLEKLNELNNVAAKLLSNTAKMQEIEQSVHYRRLALRWAREFGDYLKTRRPMLAEQLLPELKGFLAQITHAA